ncbi:Probable E3 ubiquitin-protein ligase ATL44 [Linum grandiflorum]
MIIYILYEFIYWRLFENGEGNSDVEEARERMRRRRQSKYHRLMMKLGCVQYGSAETETKSGECAICLEDYNVGEPCRIMPSCRHMFHVDCIDNWLNMKISCPLCRRCVFNLMTDSS